MWRLWEKDLIWVFFNSAYSHFREHDTASVWYFLKKSESSSVFGTLSLSVTDRFTRTIIQKYLQMHRAKHRQVSTWSIQELFSVCVVSGSISHDSTPKKVKERMFLWPLANVKSGQEKRGEICRCMPYITFLFNPESRAAKAFYQKQASCLTLTYLHNLTTGATDYI